MASTIARFLFGKKGKKHEIEGVKYRLFSNKPTAKVTRSPNATGDIVILSEVEGKIITEIDALAFSDCKGLSSVTIPESVTVVESGAFKGCKRLTRVIIQGSATNIVSGAFADCPSLTDISRENNKKKRLIAPEKWRGS